MFSVRSSRTPKENQYFLLVGPWKLKKTWGKSTFSFLAIHSPPASALLPGLVLFRLCIFPQICACALGVLTPIWRGSVPGVHCPGDRAGLSETTLSAKSHIGSKKWQHFQHFGHLPFQNLSEINVFSKKLKKPNENQYFCWSDLKN